MNETGRSETERPETERSPLRVLVAVTPHLMADALRRLLTDAGVEATIVAGSTTERFDIAVVDSGETLPNVDVIIDLHDGAVDEAGGVATDAAGARLAELDDLPAVIDFVRSFTHRYRTPGRTR